MACYYLAVPVVRWLRAALGGGVLAALLAFAAVPAFAQSACLSYTLNDPTSGCNVTANSSSAVVGAFNACYAAYVAVADASCITSGGSYSLVESVASDPATVGAYWSVMVTQTASGGCGGSSTTGPYSEGPIAAGTGCSSCASQPNIDILQTCTAGGGCGGPTCVNGCTYVSGANTLVIGSPGTSAYQTQAINGKAIPSGGTCTSPPVGTTATPNVSCMTTSGGTYCYSDGASAAVVNGDVVNPSSGGGGPGPDQCLNYPNGSVICNAASLAAPPAPVASGASVPMQPDATISQGSNVLNYYSPAQVASSASAVGTSGTGYAVSTSGSSAGNLCELSGGTVVCSGAGACTGSGSSVVCTGTDAAYGGLDCTSPPVCTASDAACNVDLQAWLGRCPSDPSAEISASIATTLAGDGLPTSTASGAFPSVSVSAPSLTSSGPFDVIGTGSSSCPTGLWSFSIGAIGGGASSASIDLSPLVYWFCQFATTLKSFVLAIAAFIGLRIVLGALLGSGERVPFTGS